jgi:hypothetical protein
MFVITAIIFAPLELVTNNYQFSGRSAMEFATLIRDAGLCPKPCRKGADAAPTVFPKSTIASTDLDRNLVHTYGHLFSSPWPG